MADLARLGFAADTAALRDAKGQLDALVPAAQRAQKATDQFNRAASGVTGAVGGAAAGIRSFNSAVQTAATGGERLSRGALLAGSAMGTVQAAAVGASASLNTLGGTVTRVGTNFAQADAHVKAYRASLVGVQPAAQGAKTSLDRLGEAANDNINRLQAAPGNIAAQFQDIGVTAAGGMSPLLIALQQGTQLSAAFAGGGLKNLGAALLQVISPVSLLTIGIVALIAYAIQLGIEFFSTGQEAKKLSDTLAQTKFSTNALGDAQSILSGVMDMTTGKINTQNQALIALARAQLLVARIQSQAREAEARTAIAESANDYSWRIRGGMGGGFSIGRERSNPAWQIESQFRNGIIDYDQAIKGLEDMRAAGALTDEVFANLAASYANLGVELANQKIYEDAQRLLDGETSGTGYLLTPDKPKKTPRGPRTDADRFRDIVEGAQNDIATQQTRRQAAAIADNAEAVAVLEQRTKLLNAANSAGIQLTDAMRQEIENLATAYGSAYAAAAQAEAKFNIGKMVDDERRALRQASEEIGLYGEALHTARYASELLNAAEDAGIKIVGDLTDEQQRYVQSLYDQAAAMGAIAAANERVKFLDAAEGQHEDTLWALQRERGELELTGEALAAYRHETEMLAQARQQNIDLNDAELEAIRQRAAARAAEEESIRRVRDALDKQREMLESIHQAQRGFIEDFITGLRNGEGVLNSLTNALSNFANKLFDRGLNMILDSLFTTAGGQSRGLLGGLRALFSANGNAFDHGHVSKYAKGGAFTNSIVSQPTLFTFAKGGALGMMGEAGPEAIMPLKRGSDGSLGVQMHGGGGPRAVTINAPVENHITMSGAMTSEDILSTVRSASEQTKSALARELPALLTQLQRDGTITG